MTASSLEHDYSIFNTLGNETKNELLGLIEFHQEKLRVETSELARELRDTNDLDANMMLLESLQVQLSQIHSLDL